MLEHFMIGDSDGALYDTRGESWSSDKPLRPNYRYHHRAIESVADLKATIRAGAYAWPGGYTLFFVTHDCAALCFKCARAEFRNILDSIATDTRDGWRVVGCDVNYEDSDLMCDHCSESIESAYGDV